MRGCRPGSQGRESPAMRQGELGVTGTFCIMIAAIVKYDKDLFSSFVVRFITESTKTKGRLMAKRHTHLFNTSYT